MGPLGIPGVPWDPLGSPGIPSPGIPWGPLGPPGYDKGSGAPAPSHRFFIVFLSPWVPGDPGDPRGKINIYKNL